MSLHFKKAAILLLIVCASCEPKIHTAADLIEAHLRATTVGDFEWADITTQKSRLNFNLKMGDKLINSVYQEISTKGNEYQKTETYQNNNLTEIILTNPRVSTMIKFDKSKFVGMNNFPAQAVNFLPIPDFQKLKKDFYLKDTTYIQTPVYQLENDSIGEVYVFDKETKYLIAFISRNVYGSIITTYSNHKIVSGFVLPFQIVTNMPESGFQSEMIFSEIKINPVFSETYFDIDPSWDGLTKGQSIPDFKLPLAENENTFVTGQDVKGKIVLIDFWATWCKPCLEEFPSIKENYTKYKEKGFEVVSISLEKDKERLIAYLDKNPFPWDYTLYSAGELKSQLASDFQIVALPKQILIDENGTIIAMDADLRAGKLKHVLKNLFDK